ncbi:MAG: ribbon-helix-helix protein, CopG family [Rothia sp. (in: high G+C Gram-positive bacteria)]|nr:ribbon-helix-helix protein, CopG family [Rothia sp. (in: high G+C Gram-positive bacteria)]
MLHLRLPEELNATIRDLAAKRGESTSEVARELLIKGLAAA